MDGELNRYAVDALDQFLAEATRHRLLSAGEELELAKPIERGDLEAKERLITHNIGWSSRSRAATRAPSWHLSSSSKRACWG